MSVRRRLTTASGAVLLTLTVAGCSGLGRTAVGPVAYETRGDAVVRVTSPPVKGCHRLPLGAKRVENGTLVDLILYRTRDCKGEEPIYLPTNTADSIVPGTLPWRSYTIVH
ncbi:hypothetical protein [Streptomyces sp. CC208A]|uniref:hypothetical protein n=1 Tax=Streptomyces sp. CC208A TaxID=3044573 RepID=UPI0024A7F9E9|nr:hypothetical protein [Streptomyces sp. CC208A]